MTGRNLSAAQRGFAVLFFLGVSACGPDAPKFFSLEPQAEESLVKTSTQALSGPVLEDDFNTYVWNTWWKADGYGNGGVFNVGWRTSNATFSNSVLTLTLNQDGCPGSCSGYPYASSEYRTHGQYGYGYYQVRMKPASGSGLVSSFFVYNDATHDEIDIEFLGKDTTRLQLNYLDNGVGGHETVIPLGFDAAAAFHTYAFSWRRGSIEWFVDGVKVHGEYGARGPIPSHGGKIMMNLWTGRGIDSWTGPFDGVVPRTASYDWMRWDE